MATPTAIPGFQLQMRRTFAARRERVFDAWITREQLEAWFCHSKPNLTGQITDFDPRPGGRYAIVVQDTEGKTSRLRGEYREIDRPEKLVFTWFWETQPEHGETTITLEFLYLDDKTEMILTQEHFPNVKSRDGHGNGWTMCFDSLTRFLEQ